MSICECLRAAGLIVPKQCTAANPGVPAPDSLQVISVPSGIQLSFSPPAARLYEYVDVYASVDSWANAELVKETRNDLVVLPYQAGTERYFWIEARNTFGAVSTRVPATDTSTFFAVAGVVEVESASNLFVDASSYHWNADTQPALENQWSGGELSYTAPPNMDVMVQVNWSGQLLISGGTSGVAVGESKARVNVIVAGSYSLAKDMGIEGYTAANSVWANFGGMQTFTVPASREITVQLTSYRDFSTSGASPAQDHHYQNVALGLVPTRLANG